MKRYKKGEFEYYGKKRRQVLIQTVILFVLAIGLYITGLLTTGSNKNLLTILAVLGLLPASNSFVSLIMYLRYHGCPRNLYDEFSEELSVFFAGYGFVFTTYKKNFEVPVLAVKNGYVYGLLTNHTADAGELEGHLKNMAKQNGYSVTVGMYTKKEELKKRLSHLGEKESEDAAMDEAVFALMTEISL